MKTNKKEQMYAFRILKPILGLAFKLYYNPKVIGKENIPKEDSIIVVGNHKHIMDQCPIILATRRPIHYMAKSEYFDKNHKDGKFAWFFKLVGCIPVNRKIHDDDAKSAAMQVLNNGWALGLFPEGTRNALKEEKIKELFELTDKKISFEDFQGKIKCTKTSQINYLEELIKLKKINKKDAIQNIYRVDDYLQELVTNKVITKEDYNEHFLLPLKYGAVSMAQKTDSYIVPFGISGEYKFRSKDLVIRIGKPFKVSQKENLEKVNKKLAKEIRTLIQKNNEK